MIHISVWSVSACLWGLLQVKILFSFVNKFINDHNLELHLEYILLHWNADKSLPVDKTPESLVVCRLDSLPSDTEEDNVGLESEWGTFGFLCKGGRQRARDKKNPPIHPSKTTPLSFAHLLNLKTMAEGYKSLIMIVNPACLMYRSWGRIIEGVLMFNLDNHSWHMTHPQIKQKLHNDQLPGQLFSFFPFLHFLIPLKSHYVGYQWHQIQSINQNI